MMSSFQQGFKSQSLLCYCTELWELIMMTAVRQMIVLVSAVVMVVMTMVM